MEKPVGYESVLSDFKACVFDGYCGEPVAWGFEILEKLGEERWEALKVHGQLQCLYPKWFLIMHELSRAEAISKYGEVKAEIFGPMGGWKSATFGSKQFVFKSVQPSAEESDEAKRAPTAIHLPKKTKTGKS